MKRVFMTFRYAAFILAAVALSQNPALAQALIIDGEEIADAKLMAAAKSEGRLEAYGTYSTESMSDALDGFRAETGLRIDYVRVPTSKLYDRVIAEFSAGKLGADYVDLTDITLIEDWVSRGILATHKVPSHDRIAPELRDANGYWYYIVRPTQAIGVNTELVAEADYPKSWKDTFDPKWKGKIGMQSIDAGGSALTLFSFLRLKVDPQSWQKIAANEPRVYATMAPAVNDLVRGRIAMAYAGSSSFSGQIENNAPIKIIMPEEGLAAFGAFGNVTSSAKRPNAAKVFINFLTSKRGSTLMSRSGGYGTHPEAPAPETAGYKFPPQSQVWTITPDQWDEIHETWVDDWKTIFNRK
jgi:iron(III) transport system substrate-binding protein